MIAMPTMAGLMKARTAATLMKLVAQLTRAGVTVDVYNIDSSEIVLARSYCAEQLLRSPRLDGLLFVDSDMEFRPDLVMKMLALDADVVAAAYTHRYLNLDAFARAMAAADGFSPEAKARALARAYHFAVVPSWDSLGVERMKVVPGGFTKMAAAGMGCALISRAALQAMIEANVVERRKNFIGGEEHRSWGFFDHVEVGDLTLSEDYSFCYRWTKILGRDLWVNVSEKVTHLGEFRHEARYFDRLSPVSVEEPSQRSGEELGEVTSDIDAGFEVPTEEA